MLTSIAYDMLVSYAVTLGELFQPDGGDDFLKSFREREYLDAHDDLFGHIWQNFGGRLEVGKLIVTADNEGQVTLRLRGRTPAGWLAGPGAN
ncbi:hypothetical protein [Singulisphaera sp. PoT]|uniref:hypothetical protein n=1 Tax=Singulisphaera sp. PoT TaxID=3411797 RepID=UPI003BF48982